MKTKDFDPKTMTIPTEAEISKIYFDVWKDNKTKTAAQRQHKYSLRKKGLLPKVEKMTQVERNRKYNYGITPQKYKSMFLFQEGKCAICGDSPKRLCVDHDHDTKKIRSLLCSKCNVLLGFARDSVGILERAVKYLNSHK